MPYADPAKERTRSAQKRAAHPEREQAAQARYYAGHRLEKAAAGKAHHLWYRYRLTVDAWLALLYESGQRHSGLDSWRCTWSSTNEARARDDRQERGRAD